MPTTEGSTGSPGSTTASGSTGPLSGSEGVEPDSGSMGADSTTELEPGEPLVEAVGPWSCSGYDDPVFVGIEQLFVDPPAVQGVGCGVSLDATEPFEGDNCGPLSLLEGDSAVRVGFVLPYPEFDDFGPIELEFRGEYDPRLDRLLGTLWNSELDEANDSECERYAG